MRLLRALMVIVLSEASGMHPETTKALLEFGAIQKNRQWLIDRLRNSAGAKAREKARQKASLIQAKATDVATIQAASLLFWLFDKDTQDGN